MKSSLSRLELEQLNRPTSRRKLNLPPYVVPGLFLSILSTSLKAAFGGELYHITPVKLFGIVQSRCSVMSCQALDACGLPGRHPGVFYY